MKNIKPKFIPFLITTFFLLFCSEKENAPLINLENHTPYAQSILKKVNEPLYVYAHNGYKIYYKKDSYSWQHMDTLVKLVDESLERICQLLDMPKPDKPFYLLMLDSRDEMEQVVGMRVKGVASTGHALTVLVYNENIRPYVRHELFHLLVYDYLSYPSNRLLDEGGAVFCDNQCLEYENPISTINRYLYDSKQWFILNDLINDFSAKARENDLIAYLQSAFVFRYLYENYGMAKMKRLWYHGFDCFETIYGFSQNDLDEKIKIEIEKVKPEPVDWERLMDFGCG